MRKSNFNKIIYIAAGIAVFLIAVIGTAAAIIFKHSAPERPEEIETETEVSAEAVTENYWEEETEEEHLIRITNLNSYQSVYGLNVSSGFEECLTAYALANGIDAADGEIFYTYLPETEPDAMQYYVELSDKEGTIVVLTWHDNERVVTSSRCDFTKEEILSQAWENIGPSDRDISPEEEEAFLSGAAGEEITPDEVIEEAVGQ